MTRNSWTCIVVLLIILGNVGNSMGKGKCPLTRKIALLRDSGYIPRCNKDGNFASRQCHQKLRECWCVDVTSGMELKKTRTRPKFFTWNCDKISLTPCERKLITGAKLVCNENNGLYLNVKCNATVCACIHVVTGLEIPGRKYHVSDSFNCSDQRSACQIQRDEEIKQSLDVAINTQRRNSVVCSVDGFYMQAQCDIDYKCSCADRETGELIGKRYDVFMFDFLCDDSTDGTETKGDCEWRKHQILRQFLPNTPIPKCAFDTTFIPKQCDEEKCWCINKDVGTFIRGTRKRKKLFDINCEKLPEQKCIVDEIENGRVVLPKGGVARPGTSVSYTCDIGYKVSRPFYNRCLPTLRFAKKPPFCIKLPEETEESFTS